MVFDGDGDVGGVARARSAPAKNGKMFLDQSDASYFAFECRRTNENGGSTTVMVSAR